MSFTVQLYDGAGANSVCVSAMERELKDKLDSKHYTIERFNGRSVRKLSDRNPEALVIPGGDAVCMMDELKLLSDQIKEVVECDFGIGVYLSCAGAIATSTYMTGLPPFSIQPSRTLNEFSHLNLHEAETFFPYYTPDKSEKKRSSPLNCTTILVEHAAELLEGKHRFFHALAPGFSIEPTKQKNYKILATYDIKGNYSLPLAATILKSRSEDYGVPAKSILATGIHPEINEDDIVRDKVNLTDGNNHAHYEQLKKEVIESEVCRHQVLRKYFESIGLELRKQ